MRIYAFIDGQNLHMSCQELDLKLDYKKFYRYLKEKYSVEQAFYFVGFDSSQKALYENLKNAEFELIFKEIIHYSDGNSRYKKGNIDADLIMKVVREVENCDGVLIVSGDGDFLPLYHWLSEKQKLFKIGIPSLKSKSRLLNPYQKYFIFISHANNIFRQK